MVLNFRRRVREQVVIDVVRAHNSHALGSEPGKVNQGPGHLVQLRDAVRSPESLLVRRSDARDDAPLAALQQPGEGLGSRLRSVDDRAHAFEGSARRVLLDNLAPAEGGGGQLLLQRVRLGRYKTVCRVAPLVLGLSLNKEDLKSKFIVEKTILFKSNFIIYFIFAPFLN